MDREGAGWRARQLSGVNGGQELVSKGFRAEMIPHPHQDIGKGAFQAEKSMNPGTQGGAGRGGKVEDQELQVVHHGWSRCERPRIV